jgi:hypothetical protein
MSSCNRYIVGRERNVVHVDFGRKPDPPKFPGAAALRTLAEYSRPLDAFAGSIRNGSQLWESNKWGISNSFSLHRSRRSSASLPPFGLTTKGAWHE